MQIVVISDTHGFHQSVSVPDGDVLVHAGDLTRRGSLQDVETFNRWLGSLPHPYKVVIAGNHDWCFQESPKEARERMTDCIYLQDESTTIEGVKFYGSPWQPVFFDWAFNLRRGPQIAQKWDMIPSDTDILITHGPPCGFGDQTRVGVSAGCLDLLAAVRRVKPICHIFGHIHEGYGRSHEDGIEFINGSTCNINYRPVNEPIVVEI